MKYDFKITSFNKDIIAALRHMCGDNTEITDNFSPMDVSPTPLRDYLKAEYKSYGGYIGDGINYTHNASGIEMKFDTILNNSGDKTLTLTWANVAKFIRGNWDEIFNKLKSAENEPSKSDTAESQLSYIDKLRERYPKVNETNDWFNYCPGDLFDGVGVHKVGECPVGSVDDQELECTDCWKLPCHADVNFRDDLEDFEKSYFEYYPAGDTDEADAMPKPTYKDVLLEHYPNFDKSRFDEFANNECVAICFDDSYDPIQCKYPKCSRCWEHECRHEWCIGDEGKEDIEPYLINFQPSNTDENSTADKPSEISEEKSETDSAPESRKMNIVYIETDKIEPHPDNPRSDIGDVSELAGSVKNGFRQNLTVIPYGEGYRCLIGHRRLAAAKLAGLNEVPCVIESADIPLDDQIFIMLTENMQRSNLPPIDETRGMQMTFDMGNTVDRISQKMGLSKSTIYRRIKPVKEFGMENVAQAYERGASFSDFENLNKISDHEAKEKLLNFIGTPNFDFEFKKALHDEECKNKYAEQLEHLKTFAEEITQEETPKYKFVDSISTYFLDFKKPDDADTVKYFYVPIQDGKALIYREYTPEELEKREQAEKEKETAEAERRRMSDRLKELENITSIAEQLRRDFIKNCDSLKGCKTQKDTIERYRQLCGFMVRGSFMINDIIDACDLCDYVGFDNNTEDYEDYDEYQSAIMEHLEKFRNWESKSMLAVLIASIESSFNLCYYNRYRPNTGTHRECPELDFIYEVLCYFGYEMSDVEKQLQDGTHELFEEDK